MRGGGRRGNALIEPSALGSACRRRADPSGRQCDVRARHRWSLEHTSGLLESGGVTVLAWSVLVLDMALCR